MYSIHSGQTKRTSLLERHTDR